MAKEQQKRLQGLILRSKNLIMTLDISVINILWGLLYKLIDHPQEKQLICWGLTSLTTTGP